MPENYTKDQIKRKEKIVRKDGATGGEIERTIFPHNVAVGLDLDEFRKNLNVTADAFVSGSIYTTGSVEIKGYLDVTSEIHTKSNLTAAGSLEVTGSAKIGELNEEPSAPLDGTGGFLYA